MKKITADMTIGEILQEKGEEVVPIFLEMGMHCLGCPASQAETLLEACMVHGLDVEDVLDKIN